MDKKAVLKARAMLTDPSITKGEVAKHFGVTRMTLNRALAGPMFSLTILSLSVKMMAFFISACDLYMAHVGEELMPAQK